MTEPRPEDSPRPAPPERGQPQPARAAEDRSARPPVVLVVEDDAAVRAMLEAGLRQHGLEVLSAPGGREAVALYRQQWGSITAVLLDVQMPDLDGPWTFIALRQINPQVRCCFMSGNTGEYDPAALLAMGAERVLQKPFRLAEVVAALR